MADKGPHQPTLPSGGRLPEYLLRLPVSDEVRQQLAELGATDAQTLLGMIRASQAAFGQWLGPPTARLIAETLEAMAPDGGQIPHGWQRPEALPLGAVITEPPPRSDSVGEVTLPGPYLTQPPDITLRCDPDVVR